MDSGTPRTSVIHPATGAACAGDQGASGGGDSWVWFPNGDYDLISFPGSSTQEPRRTEETGSLDREAPYG